MRKVCSVVNECISYRNIQYNQDNVGDTIDVLPRADEQPALAPLSLVGSGRLHVQRALDAEFWAYSVTDTQPTLSLGLVDAAHDMAVNKTIRIVSFEH